MAQKIMFIHNMSENLGIEYLSSALKKNGHEVGLAFDPFIHNSDLVQAVVNVFPFFKSLQSSQLIIDKILARVFDFNPDIVGFSVYVNNLHWMKTIAAGIKKIKNIPIVCGGPQVTLLPKKVLELPFVNYVIVGEGERAIVDLVEALECNSKIENILNVGFKHAGKCVINPVRDYIFDLDQLPMPDKLLFYEKVPMFEDCYRILTSRGCPYKCTYCVNDVLQSVYKSSVRHVRFRGIDNIISELKWAKERGRSKVVFFEDDVFTIKKQRLKDFLSIYRKEINLPFWCFVHPNTIDRDISKVLGKSGCWMVNMGMQSGSARIRKDIFGRKETNEKIIEAAKNLSEFNVKVAIDTIFGAPTETIGDLKMNTEILRSAMPDRLNTYWLVYYPKTRLTKLALEYGDIDHEYYTNIENGIVTHMSDGGNVLKNKELYKVFELLYIMIILFRIRNYNIIRIFEEILPWIPVKSLWKRVGELIISVRNRDYKFYYLVKYVFSRKQIP